MPTPINPVDPLAPVQKVEDLEKGLAILVDTINTAFIVIGQRLAAGGL
jgi:hypothetical protein